MNVDLLVTGGRVFTAKADEPFVDAVAVAGDRIVAVGRDAREAVASDVIDLNGAMSTPGFIDAHVHPGTSGLDLLRCSFDEDDDADGAVRKVAEYAAANPDLPWIVGSGWQSSWFPQGCPSKELIDRVVPDRPVLLENSDGHGAWANSKALQLAGIAAGTADPPDGRIERLADGSPQGTLHEGAVGLVSRHAPEDSVSDLVAGLIRGQEELLSHGVTGWQDANVGPRLQTAYLEMANRGDLIGRVVGSLWWERHRGLEQVDELVERRQQSAELFRPQSVKLMLDGVPENFTASMLEPYLDASGTETTNTGIDFIEPEELREIVTRLDREAFQCHFHAIGDRAVRSALDAVAVARRSNGPGGNRHHIAHLQVVHPDDIPRFSRLGVVANAQPLWACNDDYQTELTRPFIGETRYGWQYPFRALLRAGARLGMGSDWGVSTANVMREIDVAVNRTCPEGEPLGPDQALTAIEALTAFTAGSAFINHAENDVGTIAVGNLADLAILDRDPLRDGPIRETRVLKTIVGGQVVHEVE